MSSNVSEELVTVESRGYVPDSGRVKTGVKLCGFVRKNNNKKIKQKKGIFRDVPITLVYLITNKMESDRVLCYNYMLTEKHAVDDFFQ